MILRPYQSAIIDGVYNWFQSHRQGNCLVDACVGAGKSVMIAALAQKMLADYPRTRIMMTVASKELCEQNLGKLLAVWPGAPASVYSAALRSRDLTGQILYSTIGSVYSKAREIGHVDLLFVDEAHLVGEKNAGMYRRLIDELRQMNPSMRVIGWTGTTFRGDGVWLTDQAEPIFHGVAARVTMTELLAQGFLAPLVPAAPAYKMDATDVTVRGGDYVVSDLAAKVDQHDIVRAAVDELVRCAKGRTRWLVYGVTVEHAEHIAEEINHHLIPARVITGDTNPRERASAIGWYKSGGFGERALVGVGVLTTGFDAPETDCIALLRPTKSPVLYVQIAGRGMRIAPGKTDCLWVDLTDTTETLGPVDKVRGRKRKSKGEGGAPYRICEVCSSQNPAGARICSSCGATFPEPDRVKHRTSASGAAILSNAKQIAENIFDQPVDDVTYRVHEKRDKPTSLQVSYWHGVNKVADEYVCLEHEGYPRRKAVEWWRQRSKVAVPNTVAQAMLHVVKLDKPFAVRIMVGGQWPQILAHHFQPQPAVRAA